MNGIGQWTLVSYLIDKLDAAGTATATLLTLGGVLLCVVIPYLLGSVNFGLIISNKKFHDDIRTHGSGNAGATNMLRTFGWKAAVLTMAGDMLKAVIAVGMGYLVVGVNAQVTDAAGVSYRMVDQFGAAIAGLFVMLGHMFPIFFKFKGGKGVATSGMVILMISPITAAVCLAVFLIVVIGTRYVSLGSVMGLIFYPIVLNAISHAYDPPRNPTACMISVLMATLVVFMHRENLKRLINRTESKISFKKKPAEVPAEETEAVPAEPKPNLGNDPTAKRKGNKKNKSKK